MTLNTAPWLVLLATLGVGSGLLASPQDAHPAGIVPSEPDNIRTVEHWVPHVSTVPANAGTLVHLSVRERVPSSRPADTRVVLFIHGNTFPGVPGFDLGVRRYSWMRALAAAGFDTFTMDLSGYGFSPRPEMDDPCNVDPGQQASLLVPRPLASTCPPTYPYRLATSASEWDEIDTVVDYIRTLRRVERIDLIGWSRGGWRAVSYAARHPEKVGRLVLLAPTYTPAEAGDPPATLPQPGFPLTVASRTATYATLWHPGIRCAGQVEEGLPESVWEATMALDPVGRSWGPPEGVARVRTVTYWGWNRAAANGFASIPTLIISGQYDTVAPTTETLYDDLGTPEKQHVVVECASHFVPWEMQAHNLHNLSKRFLSHGTIAGPRAGKFLMDTDGNLTPR